MELYAKNQDKLLDVPLLGMLKITFENNQFKLSRASETSNVNDPYFLDGFISLATDALFFERSSVFSYITSIDQYKTKNMPKCEDMDFWFICIMEYIENKHLVITNIQDPDDYLACLSLMSFTSTRSFTPRMVSRINALQEHYEKSFKFNQILVQNSFLWHLFLNGNCNIVCESREEYEDMIKAFVGMKVIISSSVRSDGWNDVTKYVYYDPQFHRVCATHRPT